MAIEKKLISKKKPFYPISKKLENFLRQHDRWIEDVISYDDLLRYSDSINIWPWCMLTNSLTMASSKPSPS